MIVNIVKIIYFIFRIFPVNEKKLFINSFHGKKLDADAELFSNVARENLNFEISYYICPHQGRFERKILNTLKNLYNMRTSKVRISNFEMNPIYKLRKKQKYLQLWHGIPIKKIGHLSLNESILYGDSLNWTHLAVSSKLEKKILEKSFDLDKNLCYINGSLRIQKLLQMKRQAQKKKYHILLAPSFDIDKSSRKMDQLLKTCRQISFNKNDIIIGYRSHINSAPSSIKFTDATDESHTPLFEVISKYDVVITDISSIGIEFGIANKGLIYIKNDADNYFRGINNEMNFIIKNYSKPDWISAISYAFSKRCFNFSEAHKDILIDKSKDAESEIKNFLDSMMPDD